MQIHIYEISKFPISCARNRLPIENEHGGNVCKWTSGNKAGGFGRVPPSPPARTEQPRWSANVIGRRGGGRRIDSIAALVGEMAACRHDRARRRRATGLRAFERRRRVRHGSDVAGSIATKTRRALYVDAGRRRWNG